MSQQQAPVQSQQYRQPTAGGGATTAATEGTTTTARGTTAAAQGTTGMAQGPTPTAGGTTGQFGRVAGPVGQRFPTRSYLPEGVRTTSIGVLNQCLADLVAVTMQLKDAHWNVKGIEFYQLHELFDDLVELFEPHIDEIAERATALGGQALGTAHDVVQVSQIPQLPRGSVDGQTLLDDMTYRLSRLDSTLYRGIEVASQQDDLDTADLLNEVSRDVTKALWFVEAHLQGPRGTQGGAPAQAAGNAQPTGGSQVTGDTQDTGGGRLTGFQAGSVGQQPSPDSQWAETGLQ